MSIESTTRSRVEDRLDIMELTAKYAWHVDTKDLDGLMQLWVEDDPVFDEVPVGLSKSVGYENVRVYYRDEVFGKMDTLAHVTTNHLIKDITDTTASGICTILAEGDVKGAGSVHVVGYYTDEYQRVDGMWKFRSRRVAPFTKPQLGGYQPCEAVI